MFSNIIFVILWGIFSYLFGSIPFGLLYSLARGVDIRKVGSGNIGATNVSRQFGFWQGFVPVFLFDFLKGFITTLVPKFFITNPGIYQDVVMMVSGLLAILGHSFPIYLKFKGGKGVATSAGFVLALFPLPMAICLPVFLITLFTYRIILIITEKTSENISFLKKLFTGLQSGVALSSIMAALSFPIGVIIFYPNKIYFIVLSFILAIIIVIRHKSNIEKMLKGNFK